MSFNLTTSGAILTKAGANRSSGASGAMIATFCDEAEAALSTITRHNWVSDYANVAANLKPILSDAVSAYAAMQVINYDMSGYTSRAEATTMLDVLRDTWVRDTEVLKEDKNKELLI